MTHIIGVKGDSVYVVLNSAGDLPTAVFTSQGKLTSWANRIDRSRAEWMSVLVYADNIESKRGPVTEFPLRDLLDSR